MLHKVDGESVIKHEIETRLNDNWVIINGFTVGIHTIIVFQKIEVPNLESKKKTTDQVREIINWFDLPNRE